MARLLTVVNERKKLRNEYRKHLEDEYISTKKAEELAEQRAEAEKVGVKPPPTPEELKVILTQRFQKKQEAIEKRYESLQARFKNEDTAVSPLLSETDLKMISTV